MKKLYEEPRMVVARIDVADQLTASRTEFLCNSDFCDWHDDGSGVAGPP